MTMKAIRHGVRHPIRMVLLLTVTQLGLVSLPAHAQATRTWVSGVGDDANPCSRTAPCKTFAGAISKTAAGGEIDVLDPGGFGTVTITKSITIDGSGGSIGSILASATNGINVNAGANDTVILRNLSINGAGTTLGLNGINFLAGKALHVQNVKIEHFSQHCISVAPGSTAPTVTVQILDSTLNSCQTTGLFVKNPSSGTVNVNVSVEKSRFLLNGTGVFAEDGDGAGGGASVIQMSNSTVFGNTNGLTQVNGGIIKSFGNNQTVGNATNGSFSSVAGSN